MGSLILLQSLVVDKCDIDLTKTKIYTLGAPIIGSKQILSLASQFCELFYHERKTPRDIVTKI